MLIGRCWKVLEGTGVIVTKDSLSNRNLSLNEIRSSIAQIESIFESSYNNSSVAVLYGISSLLSSFKVLERQMAGASDLGCTIHPSFLTGKSYFGCMEDLVISKSNLTAVLNAYEDEFGSHFEISNVRSFLYTQTSDTLTYNELFNVFTPLETYKSMIDSMIVNPFNICEIICPLGCGSDIGCCGNYLSCCIYKHRLCEIHDRICSFTDCEPTWFCGPMCSNYLITDPHDIDTIPDPVDPPTPTYLFPSDYMGIYYYVTSPDAAHSSNTEYGTSITYGADEKYYYLNIYGNCPLPDGYYFNNESSKYYEVVGSKVVSIGNKINYCSTRLVPIQHNIPDPFVPCN